VLPRETQQLVGLALALPCIVDYRDQGTGAATTLEEALR
jgi:hypothetical protein